MPDVAIELISVEKNWPVKSPGFQVFSKNTINILKLGAVPRIVICFAKVRFREFYFAEGLDSIISRPNHIYVATFCRVGYIFWFKADETGVLAKRSE